MIEFDNRSITQAIARIKSEYSHISDRELNTAISRTLNRAASTSRTTANREIRKKYNISASRVNQEFSIRNSSANNLTAVITAKGSPLSLTNFQAKQVGDSGTTSFDRKGRASSRLNRKSRTNAIKGVSATIERGKTIILPSAFIQVSNGGITVFARGQYKSGGEGFEFAKARLPISKITTAAIPLMLQNNAVIEPTLKLAQFDFEREFERNLKHLMKI